MKDQRHLPFGQHRRRGPISRQPLRLQPGPTLGQPLDDLADHQIQPKPRPDRTAEPGQKGDRVGISGKAQTDLVQNCHGNPPRK